MIALCNFSYFCRGCKSTVVRFSVYFIYYTVLQCDPFFTFWKTVVTLPITFFFAKSRFLFLMLIKKVYNGYKTPIRFFIYNFLNGHEFQITHCVHIYKSNISICHNLA